ncbi:beta-ketoacyl synthase domain-containing protein [Apiospora saccharicola]
MSGVLSDTGNCKTYRDDADGYCRADFSGAVVLKRLEDAVAHNDNILAVVASSARNHSGNSPSITTSDAAAQERLFRKVLRNARVTPQDISYVEMHGTGTQVGDKAEMGAVSNVFSQDRRKEPLPVVAIKANMGHSGAAAGMSSLLKSILMFQKDTIPPQAGIPHSLTPKLPRLEDIGVTMPSKPMRFTSTPGKPRQILLNNFDASARKSEVDPRPAHTIVTSARTPASHLNNKRLLLEWLRATPNVRIADLAYTTTARKMHHPIRSALVATTTQEAISKLEAEMKNGSGTSAVSRIPVPGHGGRALPHQPRLLGKGRSLRGHFEAPPLPPFLDIIADGTTNLSTKDAAQVQLATLTLEIALGAVWHAAGIEPAAVMGHRLGEYAALHVAGVLSLADTLYLVGRRAGLLLERCEADSCSMLSLSAPASVVREQLDRHRALSCDIACINGPSATVVSGTAEDLHVLQEDMTMTAQEQEDGKRIRATHLPVPFAFHSFQMDPILSDYKALASGVTYWPPRVPVASCLLGTLVDGPDVFNQDYLAQQTRQKVDFIGALRAVQSKLHDPVWLEIGPSPSELRFQTRASWD